MRNKKQLILRVGGALIFAVFLAIFSMSQPSNAEDTKEGNNNKSPLCTMEEKLCSDGCSVSRIGPNCEFTPCLAEKKTLEDNKLIGKAITGSAESPDPVLERILELEKEGLVSNVVVMTSFPTLIYLRSTKKIIDELESMPRVTQ